MASLQEAAHDVGHDYISGSPHLQHAHLNAWLRETFTRVVNDTTDRLGRRPHVLEVGAGHGMFTETLVSTGATVVVTEMSEPSAAVLAERFRHNDDVHVVHDPDGSFAAVDAIDVAVYTSVLHHIPDYLASIDLAVARIRPGGALLSFQDPLWYPRLARRTRYAERAAFYAWRLGKGNLRRGVATTVRQIRGVHDESKPGDMVEYHGMRQGVDERAIIDRLGPDFASVGLQRYWSTPSTLGQSLGESLSAPNTFGIVAEQRLAPS